MKRVEQLESLALEQRAHLKSSIVALRQRLTLPELADEAAKLIGPGPPHLLPVVAALGRHPILSATLLTVAGWLVWRRLPGSLAWQTKLPKQRGSRHAAISRKRRK